MINAVGEEFTVQYIAYRRDSRVELIAPAILDWASFEEKLNACLLEVPVY
jgi:hypothetical protein